MTGIAGRPRKEPSRPLTPAEVSEILSTLQDAQAHSRYLLARYLRLRGYPDIVLAVPSETIFERLVTALDAENEVITDVLGKDLRALAHRREYQKDFKRKQRAEARAAKQEDANSAEA
jgi:hypothetical protein